MFETSFGGLHCNTCHTRIDMMKFLTVAWPGCTGPAEVFCDFPCMAAYEALSLWGNDAHTALCFASQGEHADPDPGYLLSMGANAVTHCLFCDESLPEADNYIGIVVEVPFGRTWAVCSGEHMSQAASIVAGTEATHARVCLGGE